MIIMATTLAMKCNAVGRKRSLMPSLGAYQHTPTLVVGLICEEDGKVFMAEEALNELVYNLKLGQSSH
jgi:hypothetical protein